MSKQPRRSSRHRSGSKRDTATSTTYIIPSIRILSTAEEAAKAFADGSTELALLGIDGSASLDDVARGARNLIVGEPGVGKTLLLEKLEDLYRDHGEPHLRVRLRDQTALARAARFCRENGGQTCRLLLDALDEVSARAFPEALRTIEQLSAGYPRTSIHISSRWVFARRYASTFQAYRYVLPLPFSRPQVREYLLAEGCTEADVRTLLGRVLSFEHAQLIVQIPRYLAYLAAYLKSKGADAASRVSRNELFEYFIYSKLELEDRKLTTDRKAIVKRVLEKLALIMEIYQANTITQDELMTFFDEVRSDLKQVALAQVPLETFYSASLIKVGHDDPDRLEFENTEFQEYLAAKEITRFADPNRAAFRFAADPDAKEIYPSWFNALTFLVDMEPSLLPQLVEFSGLRGTHLKVADEALLRFLGRIDTSPLTVNQRRTLFKDILAYYQRTLQWLAWTLGPTLARLFDPTLEPDLKSAVASAWNETGTRRFVVLGNIAHIVGALLEGGIALDHDYWRGQLLAFTKDTNDNGVLQRHALCALTALNDPTAIDEVPDLSRAEELLAREFLSMCGAVGPSHPKSIEYSLSALRGGNPDGRAALTSVSETEPLKKLLHSLLDDEGVRHEFLDLSSMSAAHDERLVASIAGAADEELLILCEDVLLRSLDHSTGHDVERSRFIAGLWSLLRSRRTDFIANFIARLSKEPQARVAFHFLRSLAAATLRAEDVAAFVAAMRAAGESGAAIVSVLATAKATRGAEGASVFRAGRRMLPKEYRSWDEHQRRLTRKTMHEDKRLLEQFEAYLEPQPGKFSHGVFDFYNQHAKTLELLISAGQKQRLADLITGTIFKFIDPSTFKLTIIETQPGGARATA